MKSAPISRKRTQPSFVSAEFQYCCCRLDHRMSPPIRWSPGSYVATWDLTRNVSARNIAIAISGICRWGTFGYSPWTDQQRSQGKCTQRYRKSPNVRTDYLKVAF